MGVKYQSGNGNGGGIGFNYKNGLAGRYNEDSGRWEFDGKSCTTSYGININTGNRDGNGMGLGFNRSETIWRDANGNILAQSTSNSFNITSMRGGDKQNDVKPTETSIGFSNGLLWSS